MRLDVVFERGDREQEKMRNEECIEKNNINNTHKLTLLDVHYLTYQKTTSKALARDTYRARGRERKMKSKNEMNVEREEGALSRATYFKIQQYRSAKGETLFN